MFVFEHCSNYHFDNLHFFAYFNIKSTILKLELNIFNTNIDSKSHYLLEFRNYHFNREFMHLH